MSYRARLIFVRRSAESIAPLPLLSLNSELIESIFIDLRTR